MNSDYNYERRRSYLKSYLSAESASAYAQCLRAKAMEADGVHVYVENIASDPATVEVRILWNPRGDEGGESKTMDVRVEGGDPQHVADDLQQVPKEWKGKRAYPFVFHRNPDKDNCGTLH